MAGLQDTFYRCFIEDNRWRYLTKGLGNTLLITFFALLIGVLLGVVVAIIRTSCDKNRADMRPGLGRTVLVLLNGLCRAYLTVIRGTPVVVQLLLGVFVILVALGNDVTIACIVFGVNSGAYVAEIIRSGIMSIDSGQFEAGRSLGLNYIQTMRHIIIPQAVKNILPALGNELITLLKETSIVTVIGLRDLTKAAQLVTSKTYGGFMALFGVALVYLAMVMVLSWLMGRLERRLRSSER